MNFLTVFTEQLELTYTVKREQKATFKSYLTSRVSNTSQLSAEQALNYHDTHRCLFL
jgi:hypothetical protein